MPHYSCSSDSAIRVYKPDHTDHSLAQNRPNQGPDLGSRDSLEEEEVTGEGPRTASFYNREEKEGQSHRTPTHQEIFGDDTYQQSD